MSNDTALDITFRLKQSELPSVEVQYSTLWRLAKSLERAGLPIDGWYPPAETPEASMLNKAFDSLGPTTAAVARATAAGETYPGVRCLGANGIEGDGGLVFTDNLVLTGPCTCSVDSTEIAALHDPKIVAQIVADITEIWPASSIQVGPCVFHAKANAVSRANRTQFPRQSER